MSDINKTENITRQAVLTHEEQSEDNVTQTKQSAHTSYLQPCLFVTSDAGGGERENQQVPLRKLQGKTEPPHSTKRILVVGILQLYILVSVGEFPQTFSVWSFSTRTTSPI